MVIYPITFEMYQFCYGFSLIDLPWLNKFIGGYLANQADYVPNPYIMYYFNLSTVSTYCLAFILFGLLMIVKFVYFYQSKAELAKIKFTQIVYSIFIFGLILSGSLALQGAFYNPIKTVSLNSFFYIVGILSYVGIFLEIVYSIYKDINNFYKARVFLKASLLSIGHINPITVFSITLVIDVLLMLVQFFIA